MDRTIEHKGFPGYEEEILAAEPQGRLRGTRQGGRIFLPMASRNSIIEYLTTTRIGEKGQLTIPLQFRDDLRLSKGAPFAVLRLGDGLILLPEQQRFEKLCEELTANLAAADIDKNELMATLPEARYRVYAHRYGKNERKRSSHRRKISRVK